MQPINFVILAAGIGYKMRSYEPRSMLRFNKIPLIMHQIKEIRKLNIPHNIYVVTGYKSSKIARKLAKEKVTIFNNEEYELCNQAGSLRKLWLENSLDNMFLIHGDIYFRPDSMPEYDKSFVLYDSEGRFKDKEVGVNIGESLVGSLSYGVKTKWAQMAYIGPENIDLLDDILLPEYDYRLTFEVINEIISRGGKMKALPFDGHIFEIDRIKEYKIENFNFE
jgi:CTP:phosphocholine cytidylyltransferase-like protein